MRYAAPGDPVVFTLTNAPVGLAGTVGFRLRDPATATDTLPRTTTGIAEVDGPSGIYEITAYAPGAPGEYEGIWDTGGLTPQFTVDGDHLTVTPAAAAPLTSASAGGAGAFPDRGQRQPQTALTGLTAPLSTTLGPVFKLRVTPVQGTASGEGFDDAPGAQNRATLLMRAKAIDGTPVHLIAGDRVLVASREPSLSDEWEVIREPREIRARTRVKFFETEAERVSLLYKYTATLTEQGGTPVVDAAVPVALYAAADDRTFGQGVSVDWSGQAPYRYLPELRSNRWLLVPQLGKRLHIVQATPHHTIPRVQLRLREARAI